MLVLHCILCTLYYRTTGTTMKETPQKDKEEGAAGPFVIPLEGEARGFFRPGAPKNIQRRETDNPVSNEVVATEGNKDSSHHYQTKRGRFSLFLSVRLSARPEKSQSVPATETRTRRERRREERNGGGVAFLLALYFVFLLLLLEESAAEKRAIALGGFLDLVLFSRGEKDRGRMEDGWGWPPEGGGSEIRRLAQVGR